MRARTARFFFDRDRLAAGVELDDAIGLRVAYLIGKDGGAGSRPGSLLQQTRQTAAIKDIVAEDQRHRPIADEFAADDKGLRQPAGIGLLGIGDRDAPPAAVADQGLETLALARRGNDEDVT